MQNTTKRGRGRPSIASIVAPVLDEDGIAAYDIQGKTPVDSTRLAGIKRQVDRLRGRDHDITIQRQGRKQILVFSDDSALA